MNPYIWPATCDVCGEEGVSRDASAGWMGPVVHKDPRVCIANLRAERERLEQESRKPAANEQLSEEDY